MKKTVTIFVLFFILLILSGCSEKSDVKILTLAHGMNPKHPVSVAIEYFAELVEKESDGEIKIKIFPNEELGNEPDLIQQVQLGCLDMAKTNSSTLESFIPEYGVLSIPYLFDNDEQYWRVLKGEIGKGILKSGEIYGLKGLTFYDAGARSFYTTNTPILKPDDLKGLKIRTQSSVISIEMIKVLGGSPTPLPFGELYTALQQKVIDGAENNTPSLYTTRQYEVCKYYSLDEHSRPADVLMISQVTWERLSENIKNILLDAVEKSLEFQIDLWKKQSKSDLEKMKENGLEVFEVDKKPFQEKVEPMYDNLSLKMRGLVEYIKSLE